jgi:hypothetical protein
MTSFYDKAGGHALLGGASTTNRLPVGNEIENWAVDVQWKFIS